MRQVSSGSSAAGKLTLRSSATRVSCSNCSGAAAAGVGMVAGAVETTLGSTACSTSMSPKVTALMNSAVTDDRPNTATSTCPVTTCRRCSPVPRARLNTLRQPPWRRCSSTSPEMASSSIDSATAAAVMRPVSPSRKERCRFLNQRMRGEAWYSPSTRPLSGSTRLATAWPLSKP